MEPYKDYEKLLLKIAHRYEYKGIEFDDLMGIANENFVKADRDYEKERKIKFSTLLYFYTRNDIITTMIKNQRYKNIFVEDLGTVADNSLNPERRICFIGQIRSASREAQEVIKIILSSPTDLIQEAKSTCPRKIRGHLRKILTEKNWSNNKIAKTFKEIKEIV